MRHAGSLGRHPFRNNSPDFFRPALQILAPPARATSSRVAAVASLSVRLNASLTGLYATLQYWRLSPSHTVVGTETAWQRLSSSKHHVSLPWAAFRPRPIQSRRYAQKSGSISRKQNADVGRGTMSFKPLSAVQISKVFGPTVNPAIGNRLLRTVQQQRLDGMLDEVVAEKDTDDVMTSQALLWLRQTYPMDEDAAMIRRVDREERELEEKYLTEIQKAENWRPQDRAEQEGIYGRSAFEELRKEKEERRAEEKRAIEANKQTRETTLVQNAPRRAILDRRKASAEWVRKYKERAQILDVWDPEKVSTVRRMLPSGAFVAMFVGACCLLAQSYKSAEGDRRLLPNVTPSRATVGTIMAVNLAIYVAWRYPPFWRIGNRYFLVVAAFPKPASLLGSTFSHQQFHHLAGNMFFLWLVGPKRERPSLPALLR